MSLKLTLAGGITFVAGLHTIVITNNHEISIPVPEGATVLLDPKLAGVVQEDGYLRTPAQGSFILLATHDTTFNQFRVTQPTPEQIQGVVAENKDEFTKEFEKLSEWLNSYFQNMSKDSEVLKLLALLVTFYELPQLKKLYEVFKESLSGLDWTKISNEISALVQKPQPEPESVN